MSVEIEYNNPDFPKDTEFDLGGVLVPNGGKVKLDDDQELAFVSRHQKAVRDKLGNSDNVTVTGTAKYGPAEVEKMFPAPQVAEGEAPYAKKSTSTATTTSTTGGDES